MVTRTAIMTKPGNLCVFQIALPYNPCSSSAMPRMKKQRLQKEYRVAVTEYHRITAYLKAAQGILTRPERELLLEFADLANRNLIGYARL